MKVPCNPSNEGERLTALRDFDVLDTLPEQAYDDLTVIAAQSCETPIAAISLIDAQRQWFKSKVGIEVQETPRDIAFCSHTILNPGELLIVEDTLLDDRFENNPLVSSGPRIRFYAGAPLVTSDGIALGALCVIDQKPRTLTQAQQGALQALSRQVIAQFELRRALQLLQERSSELAESNSELEKRAETIAQSRDTLAGLCKVLESQAEWMERDLSRAEVIQRSFLPNSIPNITGFCVQSLYRPGRSIGGDLYDVAVIDDRFVVLVIADAAGHGVSAAMVSVLFKQRLHMADETTGSPLRPAQALREINASLFEDLAGPAGMFVTAAFCLLDTETRELTVASAGHPPLICLHADGTSELLEHTGPALGLARVADFSERTIRLELGDLVLLYTDGLFDVATETSPTTEDIGAALRSATDADVEPLKGLLQELSKGPAREDRDDLTLLLLNAKPGENRTCDSYWVQNTETTNRSSPVQIFQAVTDSETYLFLEGRVTWLLGKTLLDAGTKCLNTSSSLVLDLTRCVYLDSTLLGTLHELVQRANIADTPLRIQGTSPGLRSAFEELCMSNVLDHCSQGASTAPEERQPVEAPHSDLEQQRKRLLRAHEVLAGLSPDNKGQFQGLIDALRAESE